MMVSIYTVDDSISISVHVARILGIADSNHSLLRSINAHENVSKYQ